MADPRPDPELAYEHRVFLESDEARPLHILLEYLEPLHRFRRAGVYDTIVFFGSARLAPQGPLGRHYEDARELARLLTQWSKSLLTHAHRYVICSGGGGGLMEAANQGGVRGRRADHRPQHQPAPRATPECLCHARSQLRVPLVLHAQAVVRASGAGAGRLSRGLRHPR